VFLLNALEPGFGGSVQLGPAYFLFQPIGFEVRPLTFLDEEALDVTTVSWAVRLGFGLEL
jgi:hypothetical protein